MNSHSPIDQTKTVLYGSGVFTTIRIIRGEPFLWSKHWRRLESDASTLGIDLSHYSEYLLRRGLDESIRDDKRLIPHKARITFTDLRTSPLWSSDTSTVPTGVSTLVGPLGTAPQPFSVGISRFRVNSRSPIAGLKTCNYLEHMMALDETRSQGFAEAVRTNERDHVTSACMANVFWLKNARLFTPALSTGCLPGTTREFVLENLECEEVEAEIGELETADAIFLTSAGLGIVAVNEIDGRKLDAAGHSILGLI